MTRHTRGESAEYGGLFARCECIDDPDAPTPGPGEPGHWYIADARDGTPPDGRNEYPRFDSFNAAVAELRSIASRAKA